MPKVVISGYYGFHNAGDEAMLYVIVNSLRKAMPELEIVVLSKDPKYTASVFKVRSLSRENLLKIYKELIDTDLLISGGGGLLQDVTGFRSILYYLGIVLMAKFLRKRVFFYGQGIGPINTFCSKVLLRLAGNKVDLVTVRESESKQELLRYGVRKPPVYITADPALGLDPEEINREEGKAILRSLGVAGHSIAGISVRSWRGLRTFQHIVASVADDLVKQGWEVILIPMHWPADLSACREVLTVMHSKAVILDQPYYFKELLAVIANLRLAVGMRLHFLIFAAMFGIPLVGISYDPKIYHFLKLIESPLGGEVTSLDYKELSYCIHQVLEDFSKRRPLLLKRIQELRQEALRNTDFAVDLLKGSR